MVTVGKIGYRGLQNVKTSYRKLQGVTRGDKKLLRVAVVTRSYKGVTGAYKG